MHQLGKKAMETRATAMHNIGWLPKGAKATQEEWIACLVALHEVCGATHMQIAFMCGGIAKQAIQKDFSVLGIANKETRGGAWRTVFYIVDGRKGTINQHCSRRGLNYQLVFTRMQREMKLDNNLTKQDALVIALGNVKARQKAKQKVKYKPVKVEKQQPAQKKLSGRDKLNYIKSKVRERMWLKKTVDLLACVDVPEPDILPEEWYR